MINKCAETNDDGQTPLMFAIFENQLSNVKKLIPYSNLNAKDNYNKSVLSYARTEYDNNCPSSASALDYCLEKNGITLAATTAILVHIKNALKSQQILSI